LVLGSLVALLYTTNIQVRFFYYFQAVPVDLCCGDLEFGVDLIEKDAVKGRSRHEW
jgi:hypothetical protein